ncbi:hypothetical protein ACH4VM_02815 [Streptomyces sp. NPDC020792]|uniref:hypothetical protein n=1 Tax=Streptomyces sp. NPDC020792 TaxID=3365089 RepID=UPI0037962B87
MIAILTALLALAAGWCCGHRTARVRHVPVGATEAQDQAALAAQERAQRHTASTITDDALDTLYARLEAENAKETGTP